MLFRPTVAPARPCRVPREVREFMAPALELAVVPAAAGRVKKSGEEEEEGGRRTEVKREKTKTQTCYTSFNKVKASYQRQIKPTAWPLCRLDKRCYLHYLTSR